MVYWFASSFVSANLQVLIDKLVDVGIYVHGSLSNVDGKLEKLKRTLFNVKSLIQKAEEEQINDSAWLSLLEGLEEAAYEADDLIDEIAIGVSRLDAGPNHNDVVSKLLSSLFKRTKAPNLSNIQDRLDDMLKYTDSLCWRELLKWRHPDLAISSKLQTSSLVDESHVFGREKDMGRIIEMLVASEPSKGDNVSIIPIVGMMGVGKTTLAQLVYNYNYESRMPHPFNLKMWVSVAKDFDVMRLTRSIIEAASRENTDHLSNLDSLQSILIEILRDKKFLLVLDDLWNEKRNLWNRLLEPLKQGCKGSKIIVTTGSHVVSELVGTVASYHLDCLSNRECWLLLKDEAVGDIDLAITPKLEAIGMEIARKCKGLPLAAKMFGSLLKPKRVDENEWNSILKSKVWELPEIKDEIIPALRLSYHLLPSYVRQCFAYCCMFPQSYDFEKDKIVQMWMGEGFIVPDKGKKMIEDMAKEYFDQLIYKSFIQIEDEKCKMHEALHDLAQSVSGDKFLRAETADDYRINTKTRHLSLVYNTMEEVTLEVSYRCKYLRTFLILRAKTTIKEVPLALAELGSLRVLDLSGTHIEDLTWSIGNLKHLRFLDLSNTLLIWLPETIQELSVLQTLRLENCSNLLYLPESTGRLKSLRHLELGGNTQLTSMPPGIGNLTSLQIVSEFIVGCKPGQMKELKNLNNIRGSLCIRQLEKVNQPQDAAEANLTNKKFLDKLELQWTSVVNSRNDEHVLDNLMKCPPERLKELTLQGYGGRMFPGWVGNPLLSQLTTICFYECRNCLLLPPLGQLPKLKSLKIDGMHELKTMEEIFSGDMSRFQSLEIIEFRDMAKLERWVGVRDNDMACLRELTLVDCPQLVIIPSLHYLRSLEKLEFENCPQLPSFTDEKLSDSVESLTITECPLLEENYYKDGGEEWTMIEHIPDITINDTIVAMR